MLSKTHGTKEYQENTQNTLVLHEWNDIFWNTETQCLVKLMVWRNTAKTHKTLKITWVKLQFLNHRKLIMICKQLCAGWDQWSGETPLKHTLACIASDSCWCLRDNSCTRRKQNNARITVLSKDHTHRHGFSQHPLDCTVSVIQWTHQVFVFFCTLKKEDSVLCAE